MEKKITDIIIKERKYHGYKILSRDYLSDYKSWITTVWHLRLRRTQFLEGVTIRSTSYLLHLEPHVKKKRATRNQLSELNELKQSNKGGNGHKLEAVKSIISLVSNYFSWLLYSGLLSCVEKAYNGMEWLR